MFLSKQAVTLFHLLCLSHLANGKDTTTAKQQSLLRRQLSSCTGLSKDSCRASDSCTWCECAAVPSSCYTNDDASGLPPGVFVCDESVSTEEEQNSVSSSPKTTKRTFSFVEGLQHTLTDAPVDPQFCDPSSPVSLSGYMDVSGSKYDDDGEDKHLFYWFFEKRASEKVTTEEDEDDIPLVVWLTGGPGCSSMLALLTENGPCSVNDTGDGTIINPYSWTESAHMLWLDQPAGVGYSYGKENDSNEDMIGEDAYYFLQGFFKSHPKYASNPLFVVGESYGGHYAPAIAHRVWLGNKEGKEGTVDINLKGLAVGNGLTNPAIQYQYYPEMAFNNSHGIQTITEETYEKMTKAIPECVSKINKCTSSSGMKQSFTCQMAMVYCQTALVTPYFQTGLNPYDIRKPCGDQPLCYDFTNVETFLNLPSTKEALHVTDESHEWVTCSNSVHTEMTGDWMTDLSPEVADMLNDGLSVLIYAGDVDFICNYMGNAAWTLDLEWSGKKEFNEAEEKEWGMGRGLVRTAGGLTFMRVYDAGHMVPTDQPSTALDMISAFMAGEEF